MYLKLYTSSVMLKSAPANGVMTFVLRSNASSATMKYGIGRFWSGNGVFGGTWSLSFLLIQHRPKLQSPNTVTFCCSLWAPTSTMTNLYLASTAAINTVDMLLESLAKSVPEMAPKQLGKCHRSRKCRLIFVQLDCVCLGMAIGRTTAMMAFSVCWTIERAVDVCRWNCCASSFKLCPVVRNLFIFNVFWCD